MIFKFLAFVWRCISKLFCSVTSFFSSHVSFPLLTIYFQDFSLISVSGFCPLEDPLSNFFQSQWKPRPHRKIFTRVIPFLTNSRLQHSVWCLRKPKSFCQHSVQPSILLYPWLLWSLGSHSDRLFLTSQSCAAAGRADPVNQPKSSIPHPPASLNLVLGYSELPFFSEPPLPTLAIPLLCTHTCRGLLRCSWQQMLPLHAPCLAEGSHGSALKSTSPVSPRRVVLPHGRLPQPIHLCVFCLKTSKGIADFFQQWGIAGNKTVMQLLPQLTW